MVENPTLFKLGKVHAHCVYFGQFCLTIIILRELFVDIFQPISDRKTLLKTTMYLKIAFTKTLFHNHRLHSQLFILKSLLIFYNDNFCCFRNLNKVEIMTAG